MDIQTVLNYTLPLLGVVIGGVLGLLSPWTAYIIEGRKRKKALKYELITNIYLFYNVRKIYTVYFNYYTFHSYRGSLNKKKSQKDIDQIIKQEANVDHIASGGFNEKMERHFLILIEYEAKIIANSFEIKHQYKKKNSDKVYSLIDEIIKRSNERNSHLAIDLSPFGIEGLKELDQFKDYEFIKKVNLYNHKLQLECDVLISRIDVLLK